MVWRLAAVWILGVGSALGVFAQAPNDLPPLSLDPPPKAPAAPAMPGVVVSQALQAPVEVPPSPLPIPVAPSTALPSTTQRILTDTPAPGVQWWGRAEYLIWWPKQQTLIPLLTGNNDLFPDIGTPGTAILIGNSNVRPVNVPGGKFSAGVELGGPNRFGLEANYFFLGTQTNTYTSTAFSQDDWRFLGIPYIDPQSGQETSLGLRLFGPGGTLQAATSTRVAGWETLLSMNLYEMPGFRLQALAGYRNFIVNEGLRIDTTLNRTVFDPDFNLLNEQSVRTDEVLTSNRFQGATVGTRTAIDMGIAFFELDSKVSFGYVRETVQRTGTSTVTTGDTPPVTSPDGLFVLSSNAGKFVQSQYAVMPEAGMKLGFTYRMAKVFFGYNLLYLNQAVRPADQLDRTLDLSNLGFGFPSPITRPSPAVVVSDFWVQGVSFGFELKY